MTRRSVRRPLPPEPESGFRVVMPGISARTFATMEAAETALALAHALGVTDARILEWPQRPTDWSGQPVYTLPEN